ncbi:MAG: hypothetical protein WCY49_01865 [Anaerovoracaceae bacterium]
MNVEYFLADPSGNITCFVKSEVLKKDYEKVAIELMKREPSCEQVAFIKDSFTMEMAGLEFCGNASRAFGLYCAREYGLSDKVKVKVSGVLEPLEVYVDVKDSYGKISMPLPLYIKREVYKEKELYLVKLPGISHFVTFNHEYDEEEFTELIKRGYEVTGSEALGVMYVSDDLSMVPVVHVKAVETSFVEGSCGTGTVALISCLKEVRKLLDGDHCFTVKQPKGELSGELSLVNGEIKKIFLAGHVEFSEVKNEVIDIIS